MEFYLPSFGTNEWMAAQKSHLCPTILSAFTHMAGRSRLRRLSFGPGKMTLHAKFTVTCGFVGASVPFGGDKCRLPWASIGASRGIVKPIRYHSVSFAAALKHTLTGLLIISPASERPL